MNRKFHKPTKAPKEREKSFFDVMEVYLATHKLSEPRRENFEVLGRCLQRFELFMKKEDRSYNRPRFVERYRSG